MLRFCSECGEEVSETANFCEFCGTRLGNIYSNSKNHYDLCVICKENEATATCPRCSRKVCDDHYDNEIPACYHCSIIKYEKILKRLNHERAELEWQLEELQGPKNFIDQMEDYERKHGVNFFEFYYTLIKKKNEMEYKINEVVEIICSRKSALPW